MHTCPNLAHQMNVKTRFSSRKTATLEITIYKILVIIYQKNWLKEMDELETAQIPKSSKDQMKYHAKKLKNFLK